MSPQISIGKLRALQQCSTPNGALSVLALDHRGNLRQALRPSDPTSVQDTELTAFKQEVIKVLAPAATAVLLDPEYGAAQCIASGSVPGHVGLLTAVEETGYTGDPNARQGSLLPHWSVAKAKRMGASGVKLLVYYHPDAPSARQIETLVQEVVEGCTASDIPVFLEPLAYSPDPTQKKLPPEEHRAVVIETAHRLTALGIDILKAEFPSAETEEDDWEAACTELSAASSVPWVLLSAAVEYETYVRQVTAACRAGASGIAVGRAVWKEATTLTGEQRATFLRGVGYARMARLTALCDALARPWSDLYPAPEVSGGWFAEY